VLTVALAPVEAECFFESVKRAKSSSGEALNVTDCTMGLVMLFLLFWILPGNLDRTNF